MDYRYWQTVNGRRQLVREDAEPKTWDLRRCTREIFTNPSDPVRLNIEFFIPLRNMIEHRWARSFEAVIAGKVQSYVINFEDTIVAHFGRGEGIGERLRLPILLTTLTADAAAALRRAHRTIPARVRRYVADFDANVGEAVRSHPKYELRLLLVPKIGPKSEADAALEFVRLDELTDDERRQVETAAVMIRERQRDVRFLRGYKPTDVVREVQARIPFRFSVWGHHTPAWKHFKVRPESDSAQPDRTDERYCIYDPVHRDYVYSEAWVEKLCGELATVEGFERITGRTPEPT